jgi:glutamyl-tRNA synthetase
LQGKFFFIAPTSYDEQVIAKKWNADAVNVLTAYSQEINKLGDLTADLAKSTLETVTANLGIGTGKILQALRVSITGGASGPDLMMTMEILGSKEVVSRIEYALNTLKKPA